MNASTVARSPMSPTASLAVSRKTAARGKPRATHAWSSSWPRARAPGSSTATRGAGPGRSTARTSSATPSATCSSTRATAARCWPRPRPATSGRPIFRSTDLGRTWKEAAQPPAFAKPAGGRPAASVDHTFWLTPGHASERDTWYAGTSPQGLFRSEDGGVSWAPLPAVNDDPQFREWMGTAQDGTPDGPKLHSIIVDPRDPAHLYFAMSGGGVHESRDAGRSWAPLIKGLEVVEGFDAATVTFHDPHCVRLCPSNPDRLYQQNHCGIYRLDRPGDDLAAHRPQACPGDVGDIGFPMVVHPRDADTAWVFPMDGTDRLAAHQPRRPPGGLRHAQRRQDLAAAGPGPAREPGLVDRQAPGDDGRRAGRRRRCTSAPPAASCGSAATRARAGRTSRGTCRRSTRWKWRAASLDGTR